jgi:hypothetical protein
VVRGGDLVVQVVGELDEGNMLVDTVGAGFFTSAPPRSG